MVSPNGIRANSIRAILFDLDGTLRHNRPSSEQTFCDYAVELGVEDGPEKRRESARWTHYYWAQSPELKQDVEAFDGREHDFWLNYVRRSLAAFGCQEERIEELAPLINKHMSEKHKPEDWVPDDVPETLQELKKAGFTLGVLSNRTLPCQDQLETLGLLRYFDFAMVAGEVSLWKPQPEIFLHAIQPLDITPQQAMYVGDNYYADIVGAQRAGLKPVLLDPNGIFPDPGCPVIHTIGDLLDVLRQEHPEHIGS